jgi:hypothetical protein
MNTYRGFQYSYRNANSIMAQPAGYYFVDANDEARGPFPTDESCMDAIDKYRKVKLSNSYEWRIA